MPILQDLNEYCLIMALGKLIRLINPLLTVILQKFQWDPPKVNDSRHLEVSIKFL